MKIEPRLDNATVPAGRTRTGINDACGLERIHRARIAQLNELKGPSKWDLVYFLDAHVDKGMRELVGLLNNRWTFTTHACHGHWAPKVRRQDPYVVFRVLPGRITEWERVHRRILAGLTHALTKKATLSVGEGYALPQSAEVFDWRFQPADRKRARRVFQKQGQWRKSMNRLIKATCRLLRKELAVRERKRALSAKGNMPFRAAQRNKPQGAPCE